MEGDIETRVRILWREAFNERNLDALDAITAPDFLNHNALPDTPRGSEGHRQVVERLWKALPDAHFEIERLASDGDTVICVGRMSGTHRDTLLGVPATGRKGGVAPMPPLPLRCNRPCRRTRRDPRRHGFAPPVR